MLSFLCAVLVCCAFLLPLNDKSAKAEEVTIPPCPCHEGDNVGILGSGNGGKLINQSCYLDADNVQTAVIYIEGTVNFCLNGFRIKCTNSTPVFNVHSGATLNLFDCGNNEAHKNYYTKGADGVYTFTDDVTDTYLTGGILSGGSDGGAVSEVNPGGTFNMYGGNLAGNRSSVYGTVYATNFNMYGGKICGNSGYYAGGVYVNIGASFYMYGGEITDNSTTYWSSGGGVYNYGSFTVSGSAKIYGNSIPSPNYDKILVNNICLQQKINVGELAEDAYLGISLRSETFNYLDGSFIGSNNSGKDTDYLLENHFFDDAGAHIHSLGDLIAEVPATCSAKGIKEHYTCTVTGCDTYFNSAKESVKQEELEIPMTEHTPEKINGTNATCTQDGLTDSERCSVCKTVTKEQTTIPKLQHDYRKGEVVEPTETEAGYTTYTCNNCGDSYKDPIPALGHTHNYREEVIEPTCTEKGYKIYTCSGCGESYNGDYTDALGHK